MAAQKQSIQDLKKELAALKKENRFLKNSIANNTSISLLHKLVEDSPFTMIIYSPDGKVLRANKPLQKLWALSKKEYSYLLENYNVLKDPQIKNSGLRSFFVKAFKGESSFIPAFPYFLPTDSDRSQEKWNEGFLYPIKDEKGKVFEVIMLQHEVTDRKKTEQALRASEEQLKFVISNNPLILFVLDKNGIFTLSEGLGLKDLGLKPGQVVGQSVFEVYKDYPEIIKNIKQTLAGKIRRAIHDMGNIVYDVAYTPIKDAQNKINGVIGIANDITEHIRIKDALSASESMLKEMMENSSDIFSIINREGKLIYNSPVAQKIHGFSEQEFKDKNTFEFIHPDDQAKVSDVFQKLIDHPDVTQTVQYRYKHKNGGYSWMEAIGSNHFGNPLINGIISHSRDVSKRKKAEEELLESEERYRNLVESFPDIVLVSDYSGKLLYANPALERQTGIKFRDLQNPREKNPFIHPDDAEFVRMSIKTFIESDHIYSPVIENRLIDKKGQVHCYSGLISKIQYKGQPALQTISRDITQQKIMLEAIKDSEERYRNLITLAPDGVSVVDLNGRFTMVNPRTVEMYGFDSGEEMIGMESTQLVDPQDLEKLQEKVHNLVDGPDQQYSELTHIRKDGSKFPVEVSGSSIRDENGRPKAFMSYVRDITERKRIEQELYKSDKIKSIGVLAGGIAHDFNNLLTTIMGSVDLAKMYLNEEDEAVKSLDVALNASRKATELTMQLLTFAKGGKPVKKIVSISQLLKDSGKLVLRGSNVVAKYDFADDLYGAKVDSGQINQVLHNLIINARQAMPEGGEILISAQNLVVKNNKHLPLKNGHYVKIQVTDHGIGIVEKQIQKIFDPFFTTKEQGRGLGLAITYSIIKNHNGFIHVTSEVGVGTTFTFYLPAVQKSAITENLADEDIVRGQGTILIMDDEESIRKIGQTILSNLGYSVKLAKNGNEVLNIYKKSVKESKTIDLVIMDLTVPGGMGGKQAMEKLLQINPKTKAIVTSGYSNDPVMANFKQYGFKAVIPKPFSIAKMSKIINKVMKG